MKPALISLSFFLLAANIPAEDINDSQKTGQVDYVGPMNVSLKWSKNVGWSSPYPVADSDGVVYVPYHNIKDQEHAFLAIKQDGKEIWKYSFKDYNVKATDRVVFSSFALSHDEKTVYILMGIGKDTMLLALNTASGGLEWRVKIEGIAIINRSRMVVSKYEIIYFVNEDGLHAISQKGKPLWHYHLKGNHDLKLIYAPVLSHDEKQIYVIMCCRGGSEQNHFLAAVDSSTGNGLWQGSDSLNLEGVYETLAIDPKSGTIYVGSREKGGSDTNRLHGFLYAFNLNGSLKWRYNVKDGDMSSTFPSVAEDGTVYITTGYVKTGQAQQHSAGVIAVDPTGRLKWRYNPPGAIFTQHPITIDKQGKVYVAFDIWSEGRITADNGLYCLDSNGKLIFKYHIDDQFWGNPPILTRDGGIYLFTSVTGILYYLK